MRGGNSILSRRKAQAWSFDIVVAMVIFAVILGVFYAYLASSQDKVSIFKGGLQRDSQTLFNALGKLQELTIPGLDTSEGSLITQGNKINPTAYGSLYNDESTYDSLKSQLGLSGEYAFYLEDANGDVIAIKDGDGKDRGCFGHPDLTVAGKPCGCRLEPGAPNYMGADCS